MNVPEGHSGYLGLTLGNPNVPQGHSQIKESALGPNENTTTYFENPI